MIKPEDLRIGNWVKYRGEYYNIWILSRDYVELDSDINDTHIHGATYSEIKPIPLAEKILLDCGFKKRKHLEDYFIELSDNCILSVTLDGVTFICGSNQQRILLPMTKHLHELQNIFYSLTKTELIIKL